jgi:hypothetical protein
LHRIAFRHRGSGARNEVIVLDNDSSDLETLGCFERLAERGVRIIRIGGPFNFARLVNNARARLRRSARFQRPHGR